MSSVASHLWRRGRARVEDNGRVARCKRCGAAVEYYGEKYPSAADLKGFGVDEDCDMEMVQSIMES